MVPVVVTVRPVSMFHKLDLVAVIVKAVAEHQVDPEPVRFRYFVLRLPKGAPVDKGECPARSILANSFGTDPIDGRAGEAEARRHTVLENGQFGRAVAGVHPSRARSSWPSLTL